MVAEAEHPWIGYRLYKVFHKKQGRWYAQLVCKNSRTTTSYARYLMEVFLGRRLTAEETVDHVNNDKQDDRMENLQLLSPSENTKKSAKGRTMVLLNCPICGVSFYRERNQTHIVKGGNPSRCSRKCGSTPL